MQADEEAGPRAGIRSTAFQMLALEFWGEGQLAQGGKKL